MTAAIDLTGMRYSRLVGVERRGSSKAGQAIWLWRCDCGSEKLILADPVRQGRTQSCGCFQVEARTKHGGFGTRTYKAWLGMKARVAGNSPLSQVYYRDRGINVSPRWAADFEAFLADMGECPSGMSLDRINNDGDYEAGNCRWTNALEQRLNSRRVHMVQVTGREMCLRHACAETGVSYRNAMKRMARGLSAQEAIDRG